MSKHDKLLSALGLNVRKRREARELTQEKLADIIDYHRPTAFVLENVKNLKTQRRGIVVLTGKRSVE